MVHHYGRLGIVLVLCAFIVPGCKQQTNDEPAKPPLVQGGEGAMEWSISSTAFENGGEIPKKHTCDADDVSPPLSWEESPEGAKELVLICDDPDAPGGTFTHWLMWGMPPESTSLPEAVPKIESPFAVGGAKQGKNDFGKIGYGGPCPPRGAPHHYYFRLYALDTATDLKPGSRKGELVKAMEGHIIGQAELMGVYGR